jgi:hypothetical protein
MQCHQLLVVTAALPLLMAGCASSPAGRSGPPCALEPADSAFVRGQPLYRDCSVDRPAKPVMTRVNFSPPVQPQRGTTCFSAEVQFVVGADGRPEKDTIRLVNSGADDFSNAVLAAVPSWQYTPAMRDGQPVRQVVRQRSMGAVTVVTSPGRGAVPPRPPNCT